MSFWEAASNNLMRAAKKMNLAPEMIDLLKSPMRSEEFLIPLRMDNGKMKVFTGYRVYHNDALGPSGGGVRISPTLTMDEAKALAITMTIKWATVGLNMGGSKGGIVADPSKLSPMEYERLVREYVRRVGFTGTWLDNLAADMGTSVKAAGWMADEYERRVGHHEATGVIDKPTVLRGTLGVDDQVAQGIKFLMAEVAKDYSFNIPETEVVIQGFGAVGKTTTQVLSGEGYKITAVSDVHGAIWNPNGLDVPSLMEHFKAAGTVVGYAQAKAITNEELLELPCDVLIPAAIQDVITQENADRIKARIVVQGANGPVTPEADEILYAKGITNIPDVLANAGGIIINSLERIQGLTEDFWDLEHVQHALGKRMANAYRETCSAAAQYQVSMTEAAWINALSRVRAALCARCGGWE